MKKTGLISLFLIFCTNASAVTLKSLYEVAIEVDSQSSSVRQTAFNEAFGQLLIRITGKPDVLSDPQGQELLKKANSFVHSFRYQTEAAANASPVIKLWQAQETPVAEPPTTAPDNLPPQVPEQLQPLPVEGQVEDKPKQKLLVSFDERAVRDALYRAKLPVWGKTRPESLFWVVFEDSEKRMLLGSKSATEIQNELNQHAAMRGLPVLYPRLDATDSQQINVSDVWGSYKEPIKLASMRYKSEAIVAVRLLLNKDNQWMSQWSLLLGNDSEFWRINARGINETLDQGLDELASRLSKKYVHEATDESNVLIYISNVSNVLDYNRVSKYLNGLTSVKRAELVEVQANNLVFRLDLRSNEKQLKQTLALGSTLTSNDSFGMESQDSKLSYRLK